MTAERITLNYHLAEKDYMALARAMERSTLERVLTIGTYIMIGLVGLATGDFLEARLWVGVLGFEPSSGVATAAGIVCASLLAAGAYFLWLQYWRGFLQGTERFGRVTAVAEPPGITFEGGSVQTASPWNAFSRVHTTSDYVFLFFTRRQACIIPRSAFAGREDEERLLGWARGPSRPRTDVTPLRVDEAAARILFANVGNPAGGAGEGEYRVKASRGMASASRDRALWNECFEVETVTRTL